MYVIFHLVSGLEITVSVDFPILYGWPFGFLLPSSFMMLKVTNSDEIARTVVGVGGK